MKHHIRAVLFDLDGVVAFTDSYHFKAWARLSQEQGWNFDESLNHKLRGIPRLASLQVILDYNSLEIDDEEKQELADRKNGYYVESLSGICTDDLYPGIIGFLDRLKESGVKIGLCSSSKNTQIVLDALDLNRYFDTVVSGLDIKNAKPHPEIFLKASSRLRVPPFHCIVFEDAEAGIESGLAAGMKCIGVGTEENLPNAPELVQDYSTIDIEALLDSGRTRLFDTEPWSITAQEIRPSRAQYWETLFALSNGYLGIRGCPEEEDSSLDSYRGTFINRFVGYEKYNHIWEFPGYAENLHAMLNVCDWTIINLKVDGEPFVRGTGELKNHTQSLDIRQGILRRSFEWTSPSGKTVKVKTQRLASMTRRHSALQTYSVTAADACIVEIASRVEFIMKSQVLPGIQIGVEETIAGETDTVVFKALTGTDSSAASFSHSFTAPETGNISRSMDDTGLDSVCIAELKTGENITLEKHASFYSTIETEEDQTAEKAQEEVKKNAEDGSSIMIREQKEFWDRYWDKADIIIEGAPRDQQAVRFTLFQLRQSHPEDDLRSIGANGMTGDKYCGHVFWDTEMYMLPAYLYTEPETVRSLLMYRYNILDRARERAGQLQGPGACYSWNSITGEECCVVFEAATAEYHLQNAVAYGIFRYVQQTGDTEFLYTCGAEIIFETARFMYNLGGYVPLKNNSFCLHAVCGPDEYGCGVNNNCYTNSMTQWHFRYASEIYRQMEHEVPKQLEILRKKTGLKSEEPDSWKKASDNMYIPYSPELGIHMQDDSFVYLEPVDMDLIPKNTDIRELMHPLNLWRLQVVKQADVVLLMFIQGQQFSAEQKKSNYEYYEPKTCHGSSLSACMHSIIASETGKPDEAYYYFRQSVMMDLNDFKNNTSGGVHSASLGGTWMSVVNGFAGMRDYPEELSFKPALPKQWNSCSFTVVYRGNCIQVEMGRELTVFSLQSGPGCSITVDGKKTELNQDNPRTEVPVSC